jgi:molecular chaperone DnaK (HSP70)
MSGAVGIDFGTSNSVVATWRPGGVEVLSVDSPSAEWEGLGFDRIMPSVFAEGGSGKALFGWAAKRAETGRFEAVKRLFATGQDAMTDDAGTVIAVEEISTMLFAELRGAAVRQGVDARPAVITVPANSRGLARHRTKVCAGMAGFQVLALLNEPTAAAMAYAARHPGDQQLLVFDWGGGTLDVTVLRSVGGVFLEQASKGLPTKGGLDFDTRLRKLLLDTIPDTSTWTAAQRRRFDLDVELAKIQLSNEEFTVVQLPGGDSRRVTRAMFEEAAGSLIEEARRPIAQCLADIGAGAGSIDSVVMVGGTSKIPAVRRFVAELLGCDPAVGIDPMTAVGEGAAIAAAVLTGKLDSNDFFVATEHALGTIVLNPTNQELTFGVLIPRNHKLPASKTESFAPVTAEQEGAVLQVVEGDPAVPLSHPDNVVLKEFPVHWGPGQPGRTFDITYEYDVDGILHVTVTDNLTQTVLLQDDVSFGVTADKRRLVEIARRAQRTVETGQVTGSADGVADADPEAVSLLQQAEVRVIPFLPDDEAEPVRSAMQALRSAGTGELAEHKVRLREALAPYSYLL